MSAASGPSAIAAGFDDAQRRLRRRRPPIDPEPGKPRTLKISGDDVIVRAGEWAEYADQFGMPPDCPVTVLGMEGDVLYVVDALGQLAEITDNSFGQTKVQRLFAGRLGYLYWAFPRFGDKGKLTGFDTTRVRDCFYQAAGIKGLWNAQDKVRGLGGWTDQAGGLVYHAGDAIFVRGSEVPTGDYEGHFYPRRAGISEPWPKTVTDDMLRRSGLVTALQSFTWDRPQLDPLLVLGWLASSFLGAALPWRPMIFVVGDKGTGKSKLQGLIKAVLGDALHATADTTPAGISQRVKQDSLPVAVDELEAGADNTRVKEVVQLARLAASGSVKFRGGQNHVGTSFTARNCFFFSAINMPPVPPQDLSRMALLSLHPRDPSRASEQMPVVDTTVIGRMLLRRLMDSFQNFHDTYEAYRAALAGGGHDSRGMDTFGTLLACADLLLGDGLLEEMGLPTQDSGLADWGKLLAVDSLPEREDASENWRRCLTHLFTSRIDAWRGGMRPTVGQLLDDLKLGAISKDLANQELGQVDLKVRPAAEVVAGTEGWCLCVPRSGSMIAQIFKGTDWGGEGGYGVWTGALRMAERTGITVKSRSADTVRINGIARRCTLVMLNAFEQANGGDANTA